MSTRRGERPEPDRIGRGEHGVVAVDDQPEGSLPVGEGLDVAVFDRPRPEFVAARTHPQGSPADQFELDLEVVTTRGDDISAIA